MICKPRDHFQCSSSQCVPWSQVCDGVAHCNNRADEECDMCTNDLYTCKDLSRINCTLACSTLGYIPCQNYMDRKICASVMKRYEGDSNSIFNIGASRDVKNFLGSISARSIIFPVLGFFAFMVLFVFLILFSVHYKRSTRLRRKLQLRDHNHHRRRSFSFSSNSSLDYNYPSLSNENINILNKTNQKNTPHENIYKVQINAEGLKEPTHESINPGNENKKKKQRNSHSLTRGEQEIADFHIYGDAPPSYKQSKFFPIANLSAEQRQGQSANEDAHVYENIEDIENTKSNIKHVQEQKQLRKAKFQGVKKNKNVKKANGQGSSESIDLISNQRISTTKNLSSPITEISDN